MIEKDGIFGEAIKHVVFPLRYMGYKSIDAIIGKRRTNILLACFPKSGSTYISEVIGAIYGFKKVPLHRTYRHVEQDIDHLWAMRFLITDTITQQHVKYNENTQRAMRLYGLKPMVLVRNIFDVVVSVRDHLRKESIASPTAWIDEKQLGMSEDALETFITELVVPWYISFFVSWSNCETATFIQYEKLLENPKGLFQEVFDSLGLHVSKVQLDQAMQAVSSKNTRLNVGVAGRGRGLSEENISRIISMRKQYPHVDFSPIGIE